MPLNFKHKQIVVNKIRKVAEQALSAVIADFRGIAANKMTELRKLGRKVDVYIYVVRNTLLCRAIKNTIFTCLKDTFAGPTLIAYSMKHPGAAARLFKEFTKENVNFKIQAASFKGELIPVSQLDRLATLPTYEEAIKRLILLIRDSSTGRLVRTLIAIRKAKEVSK